MSLEWLTRGWGDVSPSTGGPFWGSRPTQLGHSTPAPDQRSDLQTYKGGIRNYRMRSIRCCRSGSAGFGPSGSASGSVSHKYGSGIESDSGSFHQEAKIVRKTLISTVLWLIYDFYRLRITVCKCTSVPDPDLDPLGPCFGPLWSASGSVPKYHRSATLGQIRIPTFKTIRNKICLTCVNFRPEFIKNVTTSNNVSPYPWACSRWAWRAEWAEGSPCSGWAAPPAGPALSGSSGIPADRTSLILSAS